MSKKRQVQLLEEEKIDLQNQLNSERQKNSEEISKLQGEITALKGEVVDTKSELEKKEEELESKQDQLNEKELKRLAQAYEKQELDYKKDIDRWFKFSLVSFSLVILSFLLSLYLGFGELWYDKIEYHIFNLITITALVVSLRYFSQFNKLRIDFANKKTLAQAYHNILSSTDDQEIKNRFLDEVIKVLCIPEDHTPDSNTIVEKFSDAFIEVSKNLSKQ